jgi:hypothetical protein
MKWRFLHTCRAGIAGLTFSMLTPSIALAYVGRTDNPPGTAGSIIPNGQIVGGVPFIIQNTDDPTLESIQDLSDLYKYGSDGMPISNGNDTLGGIWGFDHVSHNGVPISSNNGYKMVGQSTVSQWIAALKGDPSYVQAHLWNTTFVDSAGQTFPVSNVSQIVDMSGASFVPGDPWYDQPVYATDPPRAQVSIVGSTQVQQGVPLQFENHAWIEAYHTAYHFEYVIVTSASGQDVTSQSFRESSLQGRAPYNGETLYGPNEATMVEVAGGGATTYPPSFVESTDGNSGRVNEIDTSNLAPGRYVIHLYVKDWFNRAATAATASFTVTKSPTPPPPPPPPPSGGGCTPSSVPPMPLNQVLWYTWTPDGSGGQMLTWTDTHWQLQAVTDGQGCVSYVWVDEPITYHHDYPQNLSHFQVTGLFYDPGQPGDVWSPSNPTASQQNSDAYVDGSTLGGALPQPTYGNPARSPAVYVRVGGGVAYRLEWSGSPHDLPAVSNANFNLVNPDGDTRAWMQAVTLLPGTRMSEGDVPSWDPYGNGYPPPATEYGWVYTRIPKYATGGVPTSYAQLTAWNLTGDPGTAAHLASSATITTQSGASVTWTNPDLAQALGYPTWYFLHQIPDAFARYANTPSSWSRTVASPLPQMTVTGQLVPIPMATGP